MPNVTWNRSVAAHLLRRAGFGATQQELDQYEQMGLNTAVNTLVNYESVSNAALDAQLAQINFDFDRPRDLQIWWNIRLTNTARPLEEKMVFFWHNHFATSLGKVQPPFMKRQNDLFRSFALGNFRDMLLAVSKDPAMLFWLDNVTNRVGSPNENYARELMELFSMGEGNGYTETDIQEVARCFTGWTVRNEDFLFQSGAHDNGAKTFLGQFVPSGGGVTDGETVCNVIAAHPSTATYMTRKLFEFFAYPDPSASTVAKFADVYVSSGYNIREVVKAILLSDEFYSEKAMFANIKTPTEYVIGAIKALGAVADFRRAYQDIGSMGQILFVPPDVSGWDGGLAWINTTTLLVRANFANTLSTSRVNDGRSYYIDVDQVLDGKQFTKSGKLVNHLLDVLGPITLTKAQKKPLKNYLVFDDNGVKQNFTLDAETKDEKVRGLIHLIMAMPEYQLN